MTWPVREASRATGLTVGHDVDLFDVASILGEGLAHRVFGNVVAKFNHVEAFGSNINFVNIVGTHHKGLAVVNGFQEGIAKTFDRRGVGDQIGGMVGIGQGVDFLSI